jgi:hypothetical protein
MESKTLQAKVRMCYYCYEKLSMRLIYRAEMPALHRTFVLPVPRGSHDVAITSSRGGSAEW